jgi:hypothetical protein
MLGNRQVMILPIGGLVPLGDLMVHQYGKGQGSSVFNVAPLDMRVPRGRVEGQWLTMVTKMEEHQGEGSWIWGTHGP